MIETIRDLEEASDKEVKAALKSINVKGLVLNQLHEDGKRTGLTLDGWKKFLKEREPYDCPTCQGTGQILSKESLSMQIERWVKRAGISSRDRKIRILANPIIARFIIEESEQRLTELQDKYEIEIYIAEDPSLGLDEFQVFSLTTNEEITEEFFA